MDVKALHRQMANYNRWKQELDQRLQRFERWGIETSMNTIEVQKTLRRARQLLRQESFTVALVGEFSRGKTELINALLYTGGGRRLLPSQPGRTTMCPTEIYRDPGLNNNCVRLLPIETRRTTTSLESFKRIPQNWITIKFDPEEPEQMREAINQVSASKRVTPAEAEQLGFGALETHQLDDEGLVAIPCWRHAMISLDHPLLRQGLRIVDTPGLNALGNEPELTLKTLPEAQAILFLLGADTGVTASDMAIWRDHINMLREDHCCAVIALLNKIDAVWDDLSSEQDNEAHIDIMRTETAALLGLNKDHVLALSAKQGLLAKVGRDAAQLERSRFLHLERMLGECVLRNQQQVLAHRAVSDSFQMILNTRTSLAYRVAQCAEQVLELQSNTLPDDATQRIQQLRDKIRGSHHVYHKQALSLRTSQRLLENQRSALTTPVSVELLERQIQQTHESLANSWTTVGLSRAISHFFDGLDSSIGHLDREIERANKVLVSIYRRPENVQADSDFVNRHLLKISRERQRLRQLHQRADQFRKSINSVLASKSLFISRFINTLVQEVRALWMKINRIIEQWLFEGLAPLFHHNQYQKQLLEHHMLRLTQLQGQRNHKVAQVQTLSATLDQWQAALDQLEPLYQETLQRPLGSAEQHTSTVLAEVIPLRRVKVAQL